MLKISKDIDCQNANSISNVLENLVSQEVENTFLNQDLFNDTNQTIAMLNKYRNIAIESAVMSPRDKTFLPVINNFDRFKDQL